MTKSAKSKAYVRNFDFIYNTEFIFLIIITIIIFLSLFLPPTDNDSLDYHYHHHIHGILYLTKGCDLNIPELNIRITPEPGDYYILPPYIQHGFEKHSGESNRYCLVFNLHNNPLSHFDYNKKIEKMK